VSSPSAGTLKSTKHTAAPLTPRGAESGGSTTHSLNYKFSKIEPYPHSIHPTGSLGAYFPSLDCRVIPQCRETEACHF
jgi:hypothetical protein